MPDSKTRTAQLLAESPKIIEAVYLRNFNQPQFDKFFMDYEKLGVLKAKFAQKDIELSNVTDYFEKVNKVDVRNNKQSLKNTKGAIKLRDDKTFRKDDSPRLVSRTVLSGTLPAFKTTTRDKKPVEVPDVELIDSDLTFNTDEETANVALTSTAGSQISGPGVSPGAISSGGSGGY